MLTLGIETTLLLKDDASLNAGDGVVATVFDDPNKLEVTDYTDWFSTRIDALGVFKSVTWTPHFVAKFAILEMNQTVDLELTLPASVRNITAQYGFGSVQNATPDLLTQANPVFANVVTGDILTVISGTNAVLGDVAVLTVLDAYNIVLASPIYTGLGTATDFVFKVTRNIPSEVIIMRNVNKLCEVFMPFESIKITNVSVVQPVSIRSLLLG